MKERISARAGTRHPVKQQVSIGEILDIVLQMYFAGTKGNLLQKHPLKT